MAQTGRRPTGDEKRPLIDRVLGSPIAGLSPWIVLSLLAGPGRIEEAAAITLGMSVGLVALSKWRGQSVKLLELSDAIFFLVLLVAAATASDETADWLENWVGELSNIALVLIVLVSIALRNPFTLQYAKEETPPEVWETPLFIRINYVLTWAWAGAFIAAALAGAFGNLVLDNFNNLWTGWVIQTAAIVFAIQFTVWYPDHATGDDTRSVTAGLLAPLAGWLVPVGVLVFVFDAAPWWVGVGFIVGGAALSHQLADEGQATPATGGPTPT
ncbi:hypothetical protein PO878_17095 [Iamia majanohamensis]|uniref:Uncharacterized protein n=1 Tax=Iamia majanohamensis TaxID=467976 RepID=A0AAE9YE65_9ACTN|nr:hypothetical protein [Iamia majanohamensis]WCO66221.1 hypothetical protein PO878_17095 [Iamia majanohamensis]